MGVRLLWGFSFVSEKNPFLPGKTTTGQKLNSHTTNNLNIQTTKREGKNGQPAEQGIYKRSGDRLSNQTRNRPLLALRVHEWTPMDVFGIL